MNITRYPEDFGPDRYSLRIDHLELAGKDDCGELVFVMFNPATTVEERDLSVGSQTRRRCIRFAKSHGYGSLTEVNLFAFRCRNMPGVLKKHRDNDTDVVGPENDPVISEAAKRADMVVVAWGALYGTPLFRSRAESGRGNAPAFGQTTLLSGHKS